MIDSGRISRELAASVRLVVLDVDGVMTDGGIYYGSSPSGETVELKRFEITDGLGVKLLQRAGVRVAIVTGRRSDVVTLRAGELGIEEVHQDPGAEKLPIVRDIMERSNVEWQQVAFLSDDLADIPVLRRVALPVAVDNAVAEVKSIALWSTSRRGGAGAVREFAEALLKARGDWDDVVNEYLAEREDVTSESA
jgi:3-deoxy-D-manno-octulosonate 8-phosphate phosphatase (KDO 8-P phosphatase)